MDFFKKFNLKKIDLKDVNLKKLAIASGAVLSVIFVSATLNWVFVQQNSIKALTAKMNEDINNMRSAFENTFDSRFKDFESYLTEELIKQNSNVYGVDYTVKSYDKAENTMEVELLFALKEQDGESEVSLFYTESGKVKNISAEYDKGLYKTSLTLNLNHEYSINYTYGEEKVVSGHILDISPSKELNNRIYKNSGVYVLSYDKKEDKTYIDIKMNFYNDFGDDEKLKFTSCSLTISMDGERVESIDFSDELILESDYQRLSNDAASYRFAMDGDHREKSFVVRIVATDGYGFEYSLT